MELRDWAVSLLSADTIEGKLFEPAELSDEQAGSPLFWDEPVRPPGMAWGKRTKNDKLPPMHLLGDADNRARCLHRFAGHELLAIELMAFTLLAFPSAPSTFRKGVAHTLKDEQRHLKLYIQRLEGLNTRFGDLPLYKHFWAHTPYMKSPLQYVSTVNLTLEMANLDFAPMYNKAFTRFDDPASAELMNIILEDEIRHVSFGWAWLKKLKPEGVSEWDAWCESQSKLLNPKRARGFIIHEEPRVAAGISSEWIQELKKL